MLEEMGKQGWGKERRSEVNSKNINIEMEIVFRF